ncbi:hypothetical protein N8Z09_02705 [Methylophilaceae bacterium]|nr:hypothetical protein [Methylophilaceae bacterium]
MKCYHKLECDNLVTIQQETLLWINQHPELFETKEFWNKIDTVDFIKSCPSVVQYTLSHNLRLRECAILIGYSQGVSRHTDQGPLIAKVNIPILNTHDTYTEWYTEDNKQLARVEVNKPVVFNSSIPHQVVMGKQARTPRIMLACMFYKDPTEYLSDQ